MKITKLGLIGLLLLSGCDSRKCSWTKGTIRHWGKVVQIQYTSQSSSRSGQTIAICEKGTFVMDFTRPIILGAEAITQTDECGKTWFFEKKDDGTYTDKSYQVNK